MELHFPVKGWHDTFYKEAPCDYDIEIYQSNPEREIKEYREGLIARSLAIHQRRQEEKLKEKLTCKVCGEAFFRTNPNSTPDICPICKNLKWCKKLNFYCIKCYTLDLCKMCLREQILKPKKKKTTKKKTQKGRAKAS